LPHGPGEGIDGDAGKLPVTGATVPYRMQVPAGTLTMVIELGVNGRASTSRTCCGVKPRTAFDGAMKPPSALVTPAVKKRTYCVATLVRTTTAGALLANDWVGGTLLM
jgi:hypothetical protein